MSNLCTKGLNFWAMVATSWPSYSMRNFWGMTIVRMSNMRRRIARPPLSSIILPRAWPVSSKISQRIGGAGCAMPLRCRADFAVGAVDGRQETRRRSRWQRRLALQVVSIRWTGSHRHRLGCLP